MDKKSLKVLKEMNKIKEAKYRKLAENIRMAPLDLKNTVDLLRTNGYLAGGVHYTGQWSGLEPTDIKITPAGEAFLESVGKDRRMLLITALSLIIAIISVISKIKSLFAH